MKVFIKTGLSKKRKSTSIYFDEASPIIEVCTYKTDLKNRLTTFTGLYAHEYKPIVDDESGCKTFEVKKRRLGLKSTAPYSEERRKAAGELAKKYAKF